MSDKSDPGAKPWTVKGIPAEARNAAIAAAEREGQTIGEWLTRAIRSQVQSDHGRERAPAVVRPEADPQAELGEIERLVLLTTQLASATGAPPPKGVTRLQYGLLRDRLQRIKGPGPTGKRSGPTEPPSGSDPGAS